MHMFLNRTTGGQFELVHQELKQRFQEVDVLWKRAQEEADCTDQIDNDLDNLWNALNNVLLDIAASNGVPPAGREELGEMAIVRENKNEVSGSDFEYSCDIQRINYETEWGLELVGTPSRTGEPYRIILDRRAVDTIALLAPTDRMCAPDITKRSDI